MVLELEVHLRAGDLGERARVQTGRMHHVAFDHSRGALDVFQGDGHWRWFSPLSGAKPASAGKWLVVRYWAGPSSVNWKSTSGRRSEMISAKALPEPAPMVQPSVPWP